MIVFLNLTERSSMAQEMRRERQRQLEEATSIKVREEGCPSTRAKLRHTQDVDLCTTKYEVVSTTWAPIFMRTTTGAGRPVDTTVIVG